MTGMTGRSQLAHPVGQPSGVGLGQDLEELLDCKVDVLTDGSLHPALRERILAEARAL